MRLGIFTKKTGGKPSVIQQPCATNQTRVQFRQPGRIGRGLALLGWLSLAVSGGNQTALAEEDPFVPQGVWLMETRLVTEIQTQGFTKNGKQGPLLLGLVSDESLRNQLKGDVTRQSSGVDLTLRWGLGDRWNLALILPYRNLTQHSTLVSATTDPAAVSTAEAFPEKTISGLTDVELLSLHRPAFTDRHGLILGYGISVPARRRDKALTHLKGLALERPSPSGLVLFHYTFYPNISHSRFDVRATYRYLANAILEDADGNTTPLLPARESDVKIGWRQGWGYLEWELQLEQFSTTSNILDGINQKDGQDAFEGNFLLSYGNLNDLETGPVALPFKVEAGLGKTLQGFSSPATNKVTLAGWLYF
ncbi:MAG: hypothetical protein OEW12_04185 [Deltaproteobacteria bacterium]|nr:hypothetical protein [Deltaproteobacteria bacterium]